MTITCPYCQQPAALVAGDVIYPHRPDLAGKAIATEQLWCVYVQGPDDIIPAPDRDKRAGRVRRRLTRLLLTTCQKQPSH